MKKDKTLITKLISAKIREIDPSAEIFLFGSRARGDEKPDSDWDILVLTAYPVSVKVEQKFRHHLISLEIEVGETFSIFVYEKKDWMFRHKITPFFKNVMSENIRI